MRRTDRTPLLFPGVKEPSSSRFTLTYNELEGLFRVSTIARGARIKWMLIAVFLLGMLIGRVI